MGRILLVDDEASIRFALTELVEARGHAAVACASGREALENLGGVDVVLTDLSMPEMSGLELLVAIHAHDPALPVVLLTARGSEKSAVQAMKAGAYDYLQKPSTVDEIGLVLERALETRRLRLENRHLKYERAIGKAIVGTSAALKQLLVDTERVARRDIPVLVRGETGTGKELVASLLHVASKRAQKSLVRFNCAAIPAELADAELFGHVKGAFTGASAARQGFFGQADGGTLVLDEVGELPLALQAKLLRVLQSGEIQPVGASRVESVDVRVVACTNRDLKAASDAGQFRADLYYRLAVVELIVPTLAERREDVPGLVEEFRRRYAARFDLDDVSFAPEVIAELTARDWPGNVRELENAVARLLAMSPGGRIERALLDRVLQPRSAIATSPRADLGPGESPASSATLREQLAAFERTVLERSLADADGSQSEAARKLGIPRVTFLDKLKRMGIAQPR